MPTADPRDDDDADDEEYEVPYSAELSAATADDGSTVFEVRLWKDGARPLGLVLDASNRIVAMRQSTPAAAAADEGKLRIGDQVLSISGEACSEQRRVGEVLKALAAKKVLDLRLRRAAELPSNLPTGAELRQELAKQQEERQAEARAVEQRLQEMAGHGGGGGGGSGPQLSVEEAAAKVEEEGVDEATQQKLWPMWKSQARAPLAQRVTSAETLRAAGNAKFTSGDYAGALREYDFALELFKYERENLVRDQQQARLGDLGRGLSSDDLAAIQAVRVPCLLNASACLLKLGDTDGGEPRRRSRAVAALAHCAEVVQAAPKAASRAKAHFRSAQAHVALRNWRESWEALKLARELQPESGEVRDLQLKVQTELKALKQEERRARGGNLSAASYQQQLEREQRGELRQRLATARLLLPPAPPPSEEGGGQGGGGQGGGEGGGGQGGGQGGGGQASRHAKAEALLEGVASRADGGASLEGRDKLLYHELWVAAQPRLTTAQVREGRERGVFPARDEERVFGATFPAALKGLPMGDWLGWLTDEQLKRARGLAAEAFQRGVEATFSAGSDGDGEARRFCEGLGLLALSDRECAWHKSPLGDGGAALILSEARRPLWPFPPHTLRVVPAVMGSAMGDELVSEIDARARRPLSRGEKGVLCSNVAAWREALDQGWKWCLILEDDAMCTSASDAATGRLSAVAASVAPPPLRLLAALPSLVEAAQAHDAEWALVPLSTVDTADFFACCEAAHAPSLCGADAPSCLSYLRAGPQPIHIGGAVGGGGNAAGDAGGGGGKGKEGGDGASPSPSSTSSSSSSGGGGWRRVGPTCHAFGWLYSAPLMRALLDDWDARRTPLNPLDVWVWEVMAQRGMLGHALAPATPLVTSRGIPSVKDMQEGQLL